MGCVNSTSALDPSSTQAGGKGGKGGSNSNNRKGAASSKPEDAQATLEAAAKIQRLIRRTNSKGKIAFIAKWKVFPSSCASYLSNWMLITFLVDS